MRYRLYILIFFLFGFVSVINSQSTQILKKKTHFGNKIDLLIPLNDKFILERYDYWKSKYWLIKTDTIDLNSDLYKKFISKNNCEKVDYCDYSVNDLRNNGHYDLVVYKLDSISFKRIGYIYNARHSELDDRFSNKTCYKDFEIMLQKYKEKYLFKIDSIAMIKNKN